MDDDRDALIAIDRLLAEALDVEVSPEFAARVRQRIGEHATRTPWWTGWRIAAAAAVALIIVAALTATSRHGRATPTTVVARTLPHVQHAVPDAVRPVPPVRAIVPVADRHAPRTRAAATLALVSAQPDVLVPREEIEMYRRLIALAGQTPPAIVVEAKPVGVVVDRAVSDIRIDPISIELMAPPAGAEGERQ